MVRHHAPLPAWSDVSSVPPGQQISDASRGIDFQASRNQMNRNNFRTTQTAPSQANCGRGTDRSIILMDSAKLLGISRPQRACSVGESDRQANTNGMPIDIDLSLPM